MLKKVIKIDVYSPASAPKGGTTRIELLECGHEVRKKGSVPPAIKRKCKYCFLYTAPDQTGGPTL